MAQLLNQFSFPLILLVILIGAGILLRIVLKWSTRKTIIAEVILLIIFGAGYMALRPGQGDINSISEAESIFTNGRPSFVEFFSNYCTGCLLIRPAVDEKISEISDEFNILRVDIHTEVGRELHDIYGFTYTPEFLLIDNTGEIQWRGNSLPDDTAFALVRD